MNQLKIWFRKNWSTAALIVVCIVLFVSPDAKAWVMRQVLSTGLLNSKFEEKKTEQDLASINIENFIVKKDNGEIINTSELKGKVVFINFWASWCPPCRAEFPSVQAFYERYKANNDLVFLTVNLDDDATAGKMFLEKEKYTIPFWVSASAIPKVYFDGSLPTTVVLDKTGKIRMHHTGMADYSKESFFEEIDTLLEEK